MSSLGHTQVHDLDGADHRLPEWSCEVGVDAGFVVYVKLNGELGVADHRQIDTADTVIGIVDEMLTPVSCRLKSAGIVTLPQRNDLSPGRRYLLGEAGQLVYSAAALICVRQIGIAVAPNKIQVMIGAGPLIIRAQ